MYTSKRKIWPIVLVVVLVLVVALAVGSFLAYRSWYKKNHIFVEDAVYPIDTAYLDLRGTGISPAHYEEVRKQLPNCEIDWEVPFQGKFYSEDTTELTVTSLTDEDVALLDYLPELAAVHAEGCRDYEMLQTLQERRPECKVTYTVTVMGQEYPHTTTELTFDKQQPDIPELINQLQYLPGMEKLHIDQPAMALEELLQLRQAYPQVAVTWEKDALGATYADDVTEIDLSGRTDLTLEQIEKELAWFPALEKVVMCDCGFDNETMAAFREKMRPSYKVVWSFTINGLVVRTDDLYFMPNKYAKRVSDFQVQNLIYCEDMLCVDLGHQPIYKLDFVTGMPHLKYLIVADGPLLYIDPLSTCKELVYLELFDTQVYDYSPLLGCTALEDLNVADTKGYTKFFVDMPWLKNLWVNNNAVPAATRKLLKESLPNTRIEFDHGLHTGGGWRQLQNYYDMRELLGMPTNAW